MSDKQFPANWQISDYDPNQHMMKLSGRDYLNVQNRLLWFVRDQRDFIMRGLATTSYVIRSELIEHDLQAGYAQFCTYVRDVLGNEATMYGSETAKDFKDYAEKASTKSLGRALAMLGYGTQYAPEMDEGERVVDSPVERRRSDAPARPASPPARRDAPRTDTDTPTRPQATPAASSGQTTQDTPTVDPLALTHASALDQKRLVEALRKAGYTTQTGVQNLLLHATGRMIPAAALSNATSDITLHEINRVNEFLNRVSANGNSGKAAAQ